LIRADSEIGVPLVQRKPSRREPLPERQCQAQQRERRQDAMQNHRSFLIARRLGRKRVLVEATNLPQEP
jgi:hypothetical protein